MYSSDLMKGLARAKESSGMHANLRHGTKSTQVTVLSTTRVHLGNMEVTGAVEIFSRSVIKKSGLLKLLGYCHFDIN